MLRPLAVLQRECGWFFLVFAGVLFTLSLPVVAAGPVDVDNARIRLLPAQLPAAGYFELHNRGDKAVELVGASSAAYEEIELHESTSESGMKRMRHVDAVRIAPGQSVRFQPGGYHLMLMQPSRELEVSEHIEVELRFAEHESVTASFVAVSPMDMERD